MESMRDINRVMEREIAKGQWNQCTGQLDCIASLGLFKLCMNYLYVNDGG